MKENGLLSNTNLKLTIVFLVFFQSLSFYGNLNITNVNAVETDPFISISSPVTGESLNESTIIFSGAVGNFGTGLFIELFNVTDSNSPPVLIGSLGEVLEGNWSITSNETYTEGTYSFYSVATDSVGNTKTSNTVTVTVDTTPPGLTITEPANGAYVKTSLIEGTAEEGATVELCIDCTDDGTGQIIGPWESIVADSSGKWLFEAVGLVDGSHTLYAKAYDKAENISATINVHFILDTLRPKVSSLKVDYLDRDPESTTGVLQVDLTANEDMSYVKRNTSITINITDDLMFDVNKIANAIRVYSSTNVNTTGVHIDGVTAVTKINDRSYDITFTPSALLAASTTYYIFINPSYIDLSPGSLATTDKAGNPLYPLIKRFTTERETDASLMSTAEQQLYHGLNDPHGNFTNNTNTCSNCHSTHVSNEKFLEQPSFDFSTYNYCMACHDGTVAALPENMSQNGHFPAYDDTSVKKMATDCSTCHNPHLTWRAENPSLLDDHYVVENHPSVEGYTDDMFDSDKLLCESCHENDSGIVKAYEPVNPDDPIKVTYKVLHYRKATATGVSDDYALCFRCHDGSKPDITDIKSYYEDPDSLHRINAIDGGNLTKNTAPLVDGTLPNDGHIPCAECHGTHGSDNLNIIKNKIGHEDRRGFSASANEPTVWNASKEREFCIKCHNGSTAIYGVVGEPLQERNGHDSVADKDNACSSCHGTGTTPEEKAMSAAHAPKSGTNNP